MSEAFLRKIAPVVDLDVVRTSTLSALHRTVRANDPEITKFGKPPIGHCLVSCFVTNCPAVA